MRLTLPPSSNNAPTSHHPSSYYIAVILLPLLAAHIVDGKPDNAVGYCEWKARTYPNATKLYSNIRQISKLVLGIFLPSIPTDGDNGQWRLNDTLWPAVEIALQDISNHECILKGFRLEVEKKDTKCEASRGTKAFFDLMNASPRKVGLFGDACTSVNEPVAMAAKYWDLTQISYSETHPIFAAADNQKLYPSFYRMVPGDTSLHKAKKLFFKAFNWTRVGSVKQADDRKYALPHELFTTSLEQQHGIFVVYTAELSSEKLNSVGTEIATLKEKEARIIVADVNSSYAVQVMCEAYKNHLYGDKYVWILSSYRRNAWWTGVEELLTLNKTSCTLEQVLEALQGHFVMEFIDVRTERHMMGISGKTADDFLAAYQDTCSRQPFCASGNPYAGYAYDGVFTFALALDLVIADLWEHGSRMENDDSRRFEPVLLDSLSTVRDKFQETLNDTAFQGVTGKVKFENNERLGKIRIAQLINETYVTVGEYDSAVGNFSINRLTASGWQAPHDRTQEVRQRQYVEFGLYLLMCLFASVGILLAVVFLGVNIHFRTHKFIRMSSPNLNNLITIGSVLTYLSVILLGIDSRIATTNHAFAGVCYAKVWILSIGFTLAFGSMFSKTWRVHSIFTNIKLNKKAISDYKLFLIVGVLLLVDTIVLAVWAGVAPMSLAINDLPTIKETLNGNQEVKIVPEIEKCHSKHAIVFQAILYSYKGLLMVLGCFLAWETKNVNVPALNDSKYIGMSVYNVVLMSVLGVSLNFILTDRITESYILTSIFIIFCTTLTLCLVFVPKIVELIRNPKGTDRKYRKGMMKAVVAPSLERENSINSLSKGGERDKLMRLEQDNQVWHKFLHDKTSELWDMKEQLRTLGGTVNDDEEESKGSSSSEEDSSSDPYGGVYMGPPDSLAPEHRELLERKEAARRDVETGGVYRQRSSEQPTVLPSAYADTKRGASGGSARMLVPIVSRSVTADELPTESTTLLRRSSSKASSSVGIEPLSAIVGGAQPLFGRLRSSGSRNRVAASVSFESDNNYEQRSKLNDGSSTSDRQLSTIGAIPLEPLQPQSVPTIGSHEMCSGGKLEKLFPLTTAGNDTATVTGDGLVVMLYPLNNGTAIDQFGGTNHEPPQMTQSDSFLSSKVLGAISERYAEHGLGTNGKHREVHATPSEVKAGVSTEDGHSLTNNVTCGISTPSREQTSGRTENNIRKGQSLRNLGSLSRHHHRNRPPHYVIRYCPWLDPGQNSTLL